MDCQVCGLPVDETEDSYNCVLCGEIVHDRCSDEEGVCRSCAEVDESYDTYHLLDDDEDDSLDENDEDEE